jgi:photosystem II stability/assembly factor-like uncharacterized protein
LQTGTIKQFTFRLQCFYKPCSLVAKAVGNFASAEKNVKTMPALISVLLFLFFTPHQSSNSSKGIIYFSTDQGATWRNTSKGMHDDLGITDIATGDNALGVSTKQKGIFTYDFQAGQWIALPSKPSATASVDALYFFHGKIFAGSQNEGVFVSSNKGNSWTAVNNGLISLTIRRFLAVDNRLYAGTNEGLFLLDETSNTWMVVYREKMLQVNAMKELDSDFYIGTNRGIYKADKKGGLWRKVMSDRSLHNLSVAGSNVYALAYNELFVSTDKGASWLSAQAGLPKGLYSFSLIEIGNTVIVGQWDGTYVKDSFLGWKPANSGLPEKFPVTELATFGDIVVAASSGWSEN